MIEQVLAILDQVYSGNGYIVNKEITIPIIGKVSVDIHINAVSPSQWSLTYANGKGTLAFTGGPKVHIPKFFITSTITAVDFDKDNLTAHLTGVGAIHYSVKGM